MEILKVEDLTKTYGGEELVRAIDGISFSVEKGEFVAIIGPSGSGESTLLHIMGGVDRPSSGKVYVNGQDVYARNVTENMTLPVLMDGRRINKERIVS